MPTRPVHHVAAEAEAHAAHGVDELQLRSTALQLAAQVAEVHIHHVGVAHPVGAPHLFDELLAGAHLGRTAAELLEQRELDARRRHVATTHADLATTDVDGGYSFTNLQIGDYDVREIVPTGWETAPTFGDNYTTTVFSGAESIVHDFANVNLAVASPATIDGVVRAPSEFGMILTSIFPVGLCSTTATQELVVPRSMPIVFAMFVSCSG